MPPVALAVVLVVIVAGIAAVGVGWLVQGPLPGPQLFLAALLTGLGLAHTEIVAGVERYRAGGIPGRYEHTDLTSVWTFAGVVVLPPAAAATVTVLVHLHMCQRVRVSGSVRYRQAYTTAALAVASLTAGGVLAWCRDAFGPVPALQVLAVVIALLIYFVLNTGLILLAIGLVTGKWRWRYGDDRVELVTLTLGAVLALLLLSVRPGPLAGVFLIPVVGILHRAMAALALEEQAADEEPTGLTNYSTWFRRAKKEFRSASMRQQAIGLVRVDVDGMAQINDRFGPRTGDQVMLAVAGAIEGVVRRFDLIGHQAGSDEIVVLLPGIDHNLAELARRMADCVAATTVSPYREPPDDAPRDIGSHLGTAADPIQVTVCIGGAQWPDDEASSLHELLELSEQALGHAQRQGPGSIWLGDRHNAFHDFLVARRRRSATRESDSPAERTGSRARAAHGRHAN